MADGFAEGLVGGEGVEPFGLRLALVSQEVKQTQRLTSGGPASEKLGAEGTRNLSLRFELETTRLFNSTSILGFLCCAPSLKQAGPPADEVAEGLIRRDGVEPFARGWALGTRTEDHARGGIFEF